MTLATFHSDRTNSLLILIAILKIFVKEFAITGEAIRIKMFSNKAIYTVLSNLLPDVMWDSSHRHLSVGLPWYPMLYQALADLGWSRYIPEMLIRINLIFTIGPRIYHLANITMDRWIHWGEGVQEGCTLAGCVCVCDVISLSH